MWLRIAPLTSNPIYRNNKMVNLITAKKEKKPTKKVLMQEIASTTDLFNVASLERTNIENLIVILDLVRGAK
jgi:hypothetical protein|tara:strand:+ start:104 stop:319 length:216 start_codon:yes stop_codon:yes gene_type:complete